MVNWKEIHPDFTEELQKEWEKRGFDYYESKEWISIGMNPLDVIYCSWLRNIKNNSEEYNNYLEQVKLGSRLSESAIVKIKNFDFWKLTSEQELLLDKLIPNKELIKRCKKYGLCRECKQPNTGGGNFGNNWCQLCNNQHFQAEFKGWSSGNPKIDKFIWECQMKANNFYEVLEWIPYDRFSNVEYLAEGGFGKIYKAEWIDGAIKSWNSYHGRWERSHDNRLLRHLHMVSEKMTNKMSVSLKVLNNSQDVEADFLREISSYKVFDNINFNSTYIIKCYGISQDPETKNYIMVMDYARDGNLRQFLKENCGELNFANRLKQLTYIAKGLECIHRQGLIHKDLHPGNLLNSSGGVPGINHINCYITDLGLCRPANETNESKVYGVLPYVAPEVLKGESYTQASDVYSFGMVAYEVLTSLPPYHSLPHSYILATKRNEKLHLELSNVVAPKLLKELINRCWNFDPLKRPTAGELRESLENWRNEIGKDTEFNSQYREIERVELSKSLSELYQQIKGETKEISPKEKLWKVRNELYLEFCKKYKYNGLEREVEKKFGKLLYHSTNDSNHEIYSKFLYTISSHLDFNNIFKEQKYQRIEKNFQQLLEVSEQIKKIEKNLETIKNPLKNELKELVDQFIEIKKQSLKKKKNKQIKKQVGELKKQLKDKEFSEENIDKIIRCCEDLDELEQKLEKQEQYQTNIEILTN